MAIFKVKTNIKHNGKLYAKGEEIEMSKKDAKDLLKEGVLVDVSEEVETEPEAPKEETTPEAPKEPEAPEEKKEGDEENKVEEYDGPMAKYRVLGEIESTDEEGNVTGTLEIGSIQDVPVELGDKWVADGLAEKVEDESNENGNDNL